MLSPRGEIRGLVETAILQEQGLREVLKYQAIMRAVGGGCTELNEIGQRSGLPSDTTLRDKIERLIDLGYVWPSRNLGAGATVPFRHLIADPAFAFYYEFVGPQRSGTRAHRSGMPVATRDRTAARYLPGPHFRTCRRRSGIFITSKLSSASPPRASGGRTSQNMRTLPFSISLPADSPKSLCMLRAQAGGMCISRASPISSGHPRERYAKVAYAGRRGRVELPGERLWYVNRGPERVFFNADSDRR